MTVNPKLAEMIAEWRRLDAEADRLYDGARADPAAGDAVQEKATSLIHAIGDMEATSADDIMLKLDLACEAYGAATQPRDKFIEAGDPPLDFLYQSLLDARRIIANLPQTPERTAALKAADIVSSLEDGIATLIVIGNAMTEDHPTAEFKALVFATDKLGEDVSAIGKAIDAIHGLPAAKPEAA